MLLNGAFGEVLAQPVPHSIHWSWAWWGIQPVLMASLCDHSLGSLDKRQYWDVMTVPCGNCAGCKSFSDWYHSQKRWSFLYIHLLILTVPLMYSLYTAHIVWSSTSSLYLSSLSEQWPCWESHFGAAQDFTSFASVLTPNTVLGSSNLDKQQLCIDSESKEERQKVQEIRSIITYHLLIFELLLGALKVGFRQFRSFCIEFWDSPLF